MPKKSLQSKVHQNKETSITFRINLKGEKAIGPGKIKLLELVSKLGSISSAGKVLNMSYRRAWLLIDELNHTFKEPLVVAKQGGKGGGKADLTETGEDIIKHYRTIETDAKKIFKKHLTALEEKL